MNAGPETAPASNATPRADAATNEVARAIRGASIAAAAIGVVLSPIPLADEIVLLPVYGFLTARIARSRGVRLQGEEAERGLRKDGTG